MFPVITSPVHSSSNFIIHSSYGDSRVFSNIIFHLIQCFIFSLSYHRLPHGYAHSLVESEYLDLYHSSRIYLFLNLPCILFCNNTKNRFCPLSVYLVFKSIMDEDLPSPVTDYNPGDHSTNALKTSLPTLYIYPIPINIHSTHVSYMCKYYCLHAQKTLNAVKVACHSIFGLTLTEEI